MTSRPIATVPTASGWARRAAQTGGCVLAGLLLVGCASGPKVNVVLLPQTDADGKPKATAVEVVSGDQRVQLAQPYAVAESPAKGKINQRVATAAEVEARYAQVLKVQPPAPETVVLEFVTGTSQLTPQSSQQLPGFIQRAKARAGGEILVVGHTDRVGRAEANDALSLQRAQAVVALLKAQGFDEQLLTAVGRGEREPAVPTADEVPEPRNRRAVVIIR